MVVDVETSVAGRRSRAAGRMRLAGGRGGALHGGRPRQGECARRRTRRALVPAAVLMLAGLGGCGSGALGAPAANVLAAADKQPANVPSACSAAVLETLSSVVQRVYHEGVYSERTASAEYLITSSSALRSAVESGDRKAARAAARALLATGHMTNVTVMRGTQTFIAVGGPALAPLRGTLTGASGAPIATYVASVWADSGFLTEAGGITEGVVALRADGRSIGGSPALAAGELSAQGALTRAGVGYRYTSFPAVAYPSGTVRVYLLIPASTIAPLCGRTREDTTVDTLERVAKLIYAGEIGLSAQAQVRRVQHNGALLRAVAHREPEAARLAIDALLNEHIVRIRVTVDGHLLSDVGGPYVLAPVSAPLHLHGHTIGELELSIQDDEGYLRLARRLAGLDVLMYMHPAQPELVKDSLPGAAPAPALKTVPASGSFDWEGRDYRVFTVHAGAFPAGPLVIRVLVPIPYPSDHAASAGAGGGAQASASDLRLAASASSN